MRTKPRIYTTPDAELEQALEIAVETGLVDKNLPPGKKLKALAVFGATQLRESQEEEEKLAAYDALAADDERLATIRGWNEAAFEDGLI